MQALRACGLGGERACAVSAAQGISACLVFLFVFLRQCLMCVIVTRN